MAQGVSRQPLGEVAGSEDSIGQYASESGEGDGGLSRTLTLGLGSLDSA
jgi:hypothetical protein